MNPPSPPFLVPLTFGRSRDRSEAQNLVELGCSVAEPSLLVSWNLSEVEEPEYGGNSNGEIPLQGAVLGCQDGTLYIFHKSRSNPTTNPSTAAMSRSTSPLRLPRSSYPASSRSTSPSSFTLNQAPFSVTPRSRIVSGITTDSVEAPKNYVDFDDEPDKLKDMLKGRNPRSRAASDVLSPKSSLSPSAIEQAPSAAKRRDDPKSLLSATNSPAFTPISTSIPASPHQSSFEPSSNSQNWNLRCHVIPPQTGVGRSISGLRLHDKNRLILVLQETGEFSIFKSIDGSCLVTTHVETRPLQPPAGLKEKDASPHDVWIWKCFKTFSFGESDLILASAIIDPNSPSRPSMGSTSEFDNQEKSRIVVFELRPGHVQGPVELKLEKVGEWIFDGPAEGVELHRETDASLTFFRVTSQGRVKVRRLQLLPHLDASPQEETQPSNTLGSLPITNPFKAMKSRSAEHIPLNEDKRDPGRIALEEERDIGELAYNPSRLRTYPEGTVMRGVAWSEQGLTVFEYNGNTLRTFFDSLSCDTIQNISWTKDDSYAIVYLDRVESYNLKAVDANNDAISCLSLHDALNVQPKLLHIMPVDQYQALHCVSCSEVVLTTTNDSGARRLEYVTTFDTVKETKKKSRTIWRGPSPGEKGYDTYSKTRVTSILPIELDVIICGYGDGYLRQTSLTEMCGNPAVNGTGKVSDIPLSGYITGLHLVQNSRTHERFIVGGADDGSVAFWSLESLKLCSRWNLFITPLIHVIQFQDEKAGAVHGCVLCISLGGTIAVIAIDGLQFLTLIPGSALPLQKVCQGGNNLMLLYKDQRARLWDIHTKEFWRSMTLEKAEELLGQGGWTQLSVKDKSCLPDTVLNTIESTSYGLACASTLSLDLERFISESAAVAKSISTGREQTRIIMMTLYRLRSILSTFLTPGLNEDIDFLCHEKLGLELSPASIGFLSHDATALYTKKGSQDPWCISGEVSAARALSITALLRALGIFEEFLDDSATVSTFYATSLAPVVGPLYKPPSLPFLARRWFDSSNELRHAARVLLEAAVARLSDEETNDLIEEWQHHLPCLQPTAYRESMPAALALFLCGYMASEKYSLLSTSALTDISKSVAMYLHDEQSIYRVLAIDLCSRGFHIWQHYVDAMEMLRALFTLATSSRKDGISSQNVGAQARLAVLQIASSNTPLFMTTLGLDILNPLSVEHRKSIMQMVAFLIRKRPLVLYPNLPRLMEAVVKSLDPNSTSHRDAVLDTATEILGHVVKTFPTVDFHMSTQRLVVGTSEGAIVMYDLKTAIRLYVLEGHKKRIAACSFSPDGRRLVTVSLEEGIVLVWKVGSSFSSFFNPGAPPRQGHGGSQPFKTFPFNVGDDANMTIAETLERVHFEWSADRSVKLKIRDSVLTFST